MPGATTEGTWKQQLSMVLPIAIAGVALGITGLFIVGHRPVDPLDTPMPSIDYPALQRIAESDRLTRARLEKAPPPAEIRAVGTAFVAWNDASNRAINQDGTAVDRDRLRDELRASLNASERLGAMKLREGLLDERALQTELFMQEIDERARTNKPISAEQIRLAGGLTEVLEHSGWLGPRGQLRVPRDILRVRYKLHWTSTVFGLDDCDHAPADVCYGDTALPLEAAELAGLLAYLMDHPVLRTEEVAEVGTVARAADRRRLIYLDRMARLDGERAVKEQERAHREPSFKPNPHPILGDFPVLLARGTMLFRLGGYEQAADSFTAVLRDTPHDSRAWNWLLAAHAHTDVD